MMELQCFGAAGEVTGSCHLVRVGERRILLDCGLYQGSKKDEARNRQKFAFDPASIDAVVLSHAHIDHSGRIPLLLKRGFRGPVYTHTATLELCEIMLKDAAFLNEREVQWQNRKRERKGLALLEPLYSIEEATAAIQRFETLAYGQAQEILPGITIRLQDAGHILGSAIVEVWADDGGGRKKIVYSGDLGHAEAPILRNPAPIVDADWVILESTYGDRLHRSWDDTRAEFIDLIAAATSAKGNILIPAFAVGRSQLVLYWLAEYFDAANLRNWQIFLDSPMAIRATEAYTHYPELYDGQAAALWRRHSTTSLLPNLHLTRTTDESKAINTLRSGALIIAGSGMCTGGRIKHHLLNNLWRPECQVVIVGYQAEGTPGRALVDGARSIKLMGEMVRVAAKIHTLGGLSAHADQRGLVDWYTRMKHSPRLVLVHGEPQAQQTLADRLREKLDAKVFLASPNQVFDLREQ